MITYNWLFKSASLISALLKKSCAVKVIQSNMMLSFWLYSSTLDLKGNSDFGNTEFQLQGCLRALTSSHVALIQMCERIIV